MNFFFKKNNIIDKNHIKWSLCELLSSSRVYDYLRMLQSIINHEKRLHLLYRVISWATIYCIACNLWNSKVLAKVYNYCTNHQYNVYLFHSLSMIVISSYAIPPHQFLQLLFITSFTTAFLFLLRLFIYLYFVLTRNHYTTITATTNIEFKNE